MNTIIHPLDTRSRAPRAPRASAAAGSGFRNPSYDCREEAGALTLTVFVPGVDSSGIEIAASGPDLMVTARKRHFVRVNFDALHLERAQRDYRLTLRLGNHLDYARLHAEIADGVLSITLPRREGMPVHNRLRRAA
jgi:HSP20 family molecular chaperone IbpA